MKFTQKGFKEKLFSDTEFASAFSEVAKAELETLLAKPIEETEIINNKAHQNIINSILGV